MGKEITGDLRAFYNKTRIGHWDIPAGSDWILTIDRVEEGEAFNNRTMSVDIVPVIFFKEISKSMIVNRTNNKSITKALGAGDVEKWKGRKIALYEAPEPRAEDGFAIRVREYAPKTDEYICADCGKVITARDGFAADVIAERSKSLFGEFVCFDCAQIRKGQADEAE